MASLARALEPAHEVPLVREAHRRSLWQVMLIYLGASWGVLEAADHVVERFGMPDWACGTALLLLGFPIVVATAIVQEGIGGGEGREAGSGGQGARSASAPGGAGPRGGQRRTSLREPERRRRERVLRRHIEAEERAAGQR